jgi:integrase
MPPLSAIDEPERDSDLVWQGPLRASELCRLGVSQVDDRRVAEGPHLKHLPLVKYGIVPNILGYIVAAGDRRVRQPALRAQIDWLRKMALESMPLSR